MDRRYSTTEVHPPPPSAPAVIVVCPCCASPVDAEVLVEIQHLTCGVCGQQWGMQVDVDRISEYALT